MVTDDNGIRESIFIRVLLDAVYKKWDIFYLLLDTLERQDK